tara:strand:- start:50346 stop:54560 length:4215 start_codon:yes stop_codon:yes gene_type:complete
MFEKIFQPKKKNNMSPLNHEEKLAQQDDAIKQKVKREQAALGAAGGGAAGLGLITFVGWQFGLSIATVGGLTVAAPAAAALVLATSLIGAFVFPKIVKSETNFRLLLSKALNDQRKILKGENTGRIDKSINLISFSSMLDKKNCNNFNDEYDKHIINLAKLIKNYYKKICSKKGKVSVNKIKISSPHLTPEHFELLFHSGLGKLGVESLEIDFDLLHRKYSKPISTRELLKCLETEICNNGGLNTLTSLKLSNLDGLDEVDFERIIDFCRKLSISTLDLSNNTTLFYSKSKEFFNKTFFTGFPRLEHLILQKTGINNKSTVDRLKPLFAHVSLLKMIDIRGNNLSVTELNHLVDSDEFNFNLNIDTLLTDLNEHKRVKAKLKNRYDTITNISKHLERPDESNEHISITLLKHLIAEPDAQEYPEILSQYFSSRFKLYQKQTTAENEWQLFSRRFKTFSSREDNWIEKFVDFLSNADGRIEYIELEAKNQQLDKKRKLAAQDAQTSACIQAVLDTEDDAEVALSFPQTGAYRKDKASEIIQALKSGVKNLRKQNNDPIVDSISLASLVLCSKDMINLMKVGLGDYRTSTLDLSKNNIDDMFLKALSEDEETFESLKIIDLSDNNISINGLKHLVDFSARVGLEEINLSGNGLNIKNRANVKIFAEFIEDLAEKVPALKKLSLRGVGLSKNQLNVFKPLFSKISIFEDLDISENRLDKKQVLNLLNSPEFQTNVSIKAVVTGADKADVKTALKKRERELVKIRNALDIDVDNALPLELIDFLMRTNEAEWPEALQIFLDREPGLKQNWMRKVKMFSSYLESQTDDDIAKMFIRFSQEKNLDKYINFDVIERLSAAQNGEKINLVFDLPAAEREKQSKLIITKLETCLETLSHSENELIIPNIQLNRLNLKASDIRRLLGKELGYYSTSQLDLSNNYLGDDALDALIEDNDALATLQALNLSGNKLTAKSLAAVAELAGRVGLESLDLSNNPINPKNNEEVALLLKFCLRLPQTIPTLQKLNISNIGLQGKDLQLLRPLLTNLSSLSEVNIEQSTAKYIRDYKPLVSARDVINNLTVETVNTGKNTARSLKKVIDQSKKLVTIFRGSLPDAIKDVSMISALVNIFMRTDDPVLPEEIKAALREKVAFRPGMFELSISQRLLAITHRIKYFRSKNRLKDKSFIMPEWVDDNELAATLGDKLDAYWAGQVGNNFETNLNTRKNVILRHRQIDQPGVALQAKHLYRYKINLHNDIDVFYVEDGTIRVVNRVNQIQFVLNRYETALDIEQNELASRILISKLQIIVNKKGELTIINDNELALRISGADLDCSNKVNIQSIPFYRLQRADTIKGVMDSLPPQESDEHLAEHNAQQRAFLPQQQVVQQRGQAANEPANLDVSTITRQKQAASK